MNRRSEDDLLKYYDVPRGESVRLPAVQKGYEEERKRKVAEINKKVVENIERLQNSAEFRNYLIAMSRFHNYSWNNQLLIWVQRPSATRVAGYTTWADLGRNVRKGETGISILAPLGPTSAVTWHRVTDNAKYSIKKEGNAYAIYDEKGNMVQKGFASYSAAARKLKTDGFVERREILSVNNFKVVYVFDVSQTEGKDLPQFDVPDLTGEANQWLYGVVLSIAQKHKVTVNFDSKPTSAPALKGYYRPPDFIWIRPEESPAGQLATLLHEFAHYFTEEVMRIPRRDAETIAECAACVVGAHYGFDTGVRTFPYVAMWAKEPKRLHENMAGIQKVANKLIDELETLDPAAIKPIEKPAPVFKRWPPLDKPDLPPPLERAKRAAPPSPKMTVEEMEATYSLEKIKELARLRDVSTAGSKRDIIRRLLQ